MSEYHKGEIGQMIGFMVQKYALDAETVKRDLLTQFPQLANKKDCANCGASMVMYEHSVDFMDAKLLLAMGEVVRDRVMRIPVFNVANRVHVQSITSLTYAERSRTTWCSKLGLIAKVKDGNGKHVRDEGWLITERGFAFLRNEEVPKRVVVWRNEIQDRFLERITIKEIVGMGYTEGAWFEFGKVVQGNLV